MQKRSFDEAIRVKSPCAESWDEMTGSDAVRFCSHCSKEVNDVSKLTRREAMRLVRRAKGGLCLRYKVHPVNRTPVFISRIARKAGITAGVVSASIALAEAAYAQGGALPPVETVRVEQTEKTGSTGGSVSGYVTDSAGAAIPFAVVSVSNVGTYEYRAANASSEGFYEFKDLSPGTYTIKIEAGGFDARLIENVQLSEAVSIRRDVRLDVQQVAATVEIKDGEDLETSVTVGVIALTPSVPGVEPNELVSAVIDEDRDEVENLIRQGRKINVRDRTRDGMTPLHAAIETGNIEIMQLLLAYGAKPNSRDHEKRTPLMMMDEDVGKEMIRILLSYGADIRLTDRVKSTVLHHFAQFDEPEMMRFLIEHGADPNARNKSGQTPLMVAAENYNTEAMRVLLESGADVLAVTKKKKQTAWDLAGGDKVRELLLSYGASASGR
jgi:hypothetical protein